MKIKQKAYCILWTDNADKSVKIDNADAHTFNECPSVEPTCALAIYEKKKDAPYLSSEYRKEYKLVECVINYNI